MNAQDFKSEVAEAVRDLLEHFSDKVNVSPDGSGGAIVSLSADMGSLYVNSDEVTLNFVIPFNYPYAQVKDFYIIPQLIKHDGSNPAGDGFHADQDFNGNRATLVSRYVKEYNADRDKSMVAKLAKVLDYIRSHEQ